jgi:hypothetical protein
MVQSFIPIPIANYLKGMILKKSGFTNLDLFLNKKVRTLKRPIF